MMLAAGNLNDVVALVRIQILDASRHTTIISVSKAELTMVVQAPGEKMVFFIDVETVLVSTENINCIFRAKRLYFERLNIFVSGRQHSTYLTRFGVTPAIYFATLSQGKGMV